MTDVMSDDARRSLDMQPAWKQRSVERSVVNAKRRAEKRVEQFLQAARAVMVRNGSTDFTVQEVIDRSHQSLRSFYRHFDGKDDLLLALYEDELVRAAQQIRSAVSAEPDPMQRIRIAMAELSVFYRGGSSAKVLLLSEFAPRLLLSHPVEVRRAYAPVTAVFIELFAALGATGRLRASVSPKRLAVLSMQTVMTTAHMVAQSSADDASQPTLDEVWRWCSGGFVKETWPDTVLQS